VPANGQFHKKGTFAKDAHFIFHRDALKNGHGAKPIGLLPRRVYVDDTLKQSAPF
jgi:hypothetical protein